MTEIHLSPNALQMVGQLRSLVGKHGFSIVEENGSIIWEDITLIPQHRIPPGTEVVVRFMTHFTAEPKAEHDERMAREEQHRQQGEQVRKDRLNKQRDHALALNAQINLPVPWVPAIKVVLSGLSASSWGDGTNAATVHHILLQEDFEQGRLKRKKGDFLCTSQSGSNGERYVEPKARTFADGDGLPYPAPITCKACQRLAGIKKDPK